MMPPVLWSLVRPTHGHYTVGMRVWPGAVLGLAVTCGLLMPPAPMVAATKKTTKKKAVKRRRPPAPPRVSATVRAASLRKVTAQLEDPPPATFAQPGALVPFFEQLYLLHSRQDASPVHIIHFGDSHTAADEWTGDLRDMLKQRFGDGGSGFSLAGHPFLGYRRFDVHGGGTSGWVTEGLRSATGDGFFGLGGVSISTEHAGQSVFVETECDHLEVDYFQQPGGGTLALEDNGQHLQDFSTDGESGAAFVTVTTSPGPHRFTLRTLDSRPVRLFGWVADKETGVTYEALGINGAEASVILHWNQGMLATYMQRRNPRLIVLAYGTNEASDSNWNPEKYGAMFSALLEELRVQAPAASILVIGPPDRWSRSHGAWRPYDPVDGIIAAQQAACRANGCAFWDTRSRMGGKGSMRDWMYAGLAQGDYVHFNAAGYRRLAAVLFADLTEQFETYQKARLEIEGPHPNGQPSQDR